jgi:hypothetical protein
MRSHPPTRLGEMFGLTPSAWMSFDIAQTCSNILKNPKNWKRTHYAFVIVEKSQVI